jgi:nuclear transport factor 2 (NTF2) superfamily protein
LPNRNPHCLVTPAFPASCPARKESASPADDSGNWFRSYGNENWEFDENGLMQGRFASINDLPIKESEREYHRPLGRRPDDHAGLSVLGF